MFNSEVCVCELCSTDVSHSYDVLLLSNVESERVGSALDFRRRRDYSNLQNSFIIRYRSSDLGSVKVLEPFIHYN